MLLHSIFTDSVIADKDELCYYTEYIYRFWQDRKRYVMSLHRVYLQILSGQTKMGYVITQSIFTDSVIAKMGYVVTQSIFTDSGRPDKTDLFVDYLYHLQILEGWMKLDRYINLYFKCYR